VTAVKEGDSVRKKLLAIVIFIGCAAIAFSQTRSRLGILPFSGGSGNDGETIATLLSFQNDIRDAFIVVPRTSVTAALRAEQNFAMTGYTDSDTIARLGRQLNADFVVSGHIRRLGGRSLIITTIINVETFEQLAGDYREYDNIEEIEAMLPDIARKMIAASRRNTSSLPKLAVAPFNIANRGANAQDGETLAQILAVEIANTGKFAVLPRTTTIQAALKELEYQMAGHTAEEEAKALGMATNAEYVLSAELTSLGLQNLFAVQILNLEDGSQFAGASRNYRTIGDGIIMMKELALLLTDRAQAQTVIAANERETLKRERRDARAAFFADTTRFWSVGISVGTSFIEPWVIGSVRATIAPFRYSFMELGFDYGMVSTIADVEAYYSLYPYAHYNFFLPFANFANLYIGAGGGYMLAEYTFPEEKIPIQIFAFDVTAGINLWNMLDIAYTLRTDFKSANNKLMVGYTYRFGGKKR